MKRGAPLKRSAGRKRTGSLSRSPLARRTAPTRHTPQQREGALERQLKAQWKARVRGQVCQVCGKRPAKRGHHVVPAAIIERELRARYSPTDLLRALWSPANELAIDDVCHANHHARARPIPLSVIRAKAPGVFAFAEEHGLSWRLALDYPEGP